MAPFSGGFEVITFRRTSGKALNSPPSRRFADVGAFLHDYGASRCFGRVSLLWAPLVASSRPGQVIFGTAWRAGPGQVILGTPWRAGPAKSSLGRRGAQALVKSSLGRRGARTRPSHPWDAVARRPGQVIFGTAWRAAVVKSSLVRHCAQPLLSHLWDAQPWLISSLKDHRSHLFMDVLSIITILQHHPKRQP
jgi:hypothetical protein